MDNGMQKRAPPPVPTHRRPEMTARDEICRGENVRKAWPAERNRTMMSCRKEPFKRIFLIDLIINRCHVATNELHALKNGKALI